MGRGFLDYFKEVFHLSKKNEFIFVPSLLFNLLPLIIMGIGAIVIYGSFSLKPMSNIFGSLFSGFSIIIGIFLGLGFYVLSLMLQSGTLYLQKELVKNNEISWSKFLDGAKMYPIKLFAGQLIFSLFIIGAMLPVIFIIFMVPELVILFLILFIFLFIFVAVAISFWDKILVYDDLEVIESMKKSMTFLKLPPLK